MHGRLKSVTKEGEYLQFSASAVFVKRDGTYTHFSSSDINIRRMDTKGHEGRKRTTLFFHIKEFWYAAQTGLKLFYGHILTFHNNVISKMKFTDI